jgi:hypothetical protein
MIVLWEHALKDDVQAEATVLSRLKDYLPSV